MNTAELAAHLDTTPRQLRKFLRDVDYITSPGHGGQYMISQEAMVKLEDDFATWTADRTRGPKKADDSKRREELEAMTSEELYTLLIDAEVEGRSQYTTKAARVDAALAHNL